ncbi:MAG: FGGY-family carbohydrate kinase [Acidimicrobiales bacterium]
MDLVVGVDLATAEVRAAAADSEGRIHAEGAADLPAPAGSRPGWYEQDAATWWPATAEALRRVTDALGSDRDSVVAVSVCATSGTVAAAAEDGTLGPGLTYADQRATKEAAAAQAAGEPRWAGLGLRVQPTFGLPKWGWLVAHGTRVAALVHASDVVVSGLLGRPATEVPTDWSHALKSGYDPGTGEWATEALAALGIDEDQLPEVRPPGTAIGTVAGVGAASTGLPSNCQVVLGMTDACASQLAAGAARPGRFVSVLGTTLVLKAVSQEPVADPAGAVYSHRHPLGWWLPGGASNTGGAALRHGFSGRDLTALDQAAAGRGPARAVTYPLVGRGERFPFVAPGAEAFLLGQPCDEVERYRSVLEGVAFVERLGLDRMAALGAPAEPPLAVTGRGSTSPVWNRIRATVASLPVEETPGATTTLGACILAAAGTLHPDLAAATEAMAAAGKGATVEPMAAEQEAMDASYRRFTAEVTARGWLPADVEAVKPPRR